MRYGFLGLVVILLTIQGFAFSFQQTPAVFEKDTAISVQLLSGIDAKKAKPGDKVEARLLKDVTGRDNVLIAHELSTVVGHVVSVQPHTEQQIHSMIVLAFENITADSGLEIPVLAVVTGITPPSSKQDYPVRIGSHPTSGDDPTFRSPGATVDRESGRIIVSPRPPTTETGIAAPRVMNVPDMGPMEVAFNAIGQTRLTALDRKDVKLKKGLILTLRVNNPRPKQ